MAHHVTTTEEYYQLLNDHPGVIVDYYATWCKPCTAISPKIDEFQTKYPSIKFLKVNYDELDDVISAESVEKLPTFKSFYKKEQINQHVGVKLDELEAMIIDINNRINPNQTPSQPQPTTTATTSPTTTTPTSPSSSITPPAAHPALAVQNNTTIPKGSKQFTHVKPAPPELNQFLTSLTSTHNIILFSHCSQQPSVSSTSTSPSKSSSSTANNIVTQVVNDLQLLTARFSTDTTKIHFEHIIIDDNDQYTKTLAEEYGCEKISQLPIVKMMWKKQVYATIINGNAFDVEAKLPEFMQL